MRPLPDDGPHFEQAASALAGEAVLTKVNTEQAPDLAARFAIRGIPTLVMLRRGREVTRTSGAMPAEGIVQWVRAHAAAGRGSREG